MKIIMYCLVCYVVLLSLGCVANTDYTGTYTNGKETIILFEDGTFFLTNDDVSYSGLYKIDGDKIYINTVYGACEYYISNTAIQKGNRVYNKTAETITEKIKQGVDK